MDKFWSKVDKNGPGGCWIWTAAKNRDGYGQFGHGGKMYRAHRLAYTLLRGPIYDDVMACHHCDVPACVNPEHIFLGTAWDNARDRVWKGR